MTILEDKWLEELEQYSKEPGNDVIIDHPPLKIYGNRFVNKSTSEIRYWLRCVIEDRQHTVDGIIIHRLFFEEEYRQIRSRLVNNEKPSEVLKPYGGLIEFWAMHL